MTTLRAPGGIASIVGHHEQPVSILPSGNTTTGNMRALCRSFGLVHTTTGNMRALCRSFDLVPEL